MIILITAHVSILQWEGEAAALSLDAISRQWDDAPARLKTFVNDGPCRTFIVVLGEPALVTAFRVVAGFAAGIVVALAMFIAVELFSAVAYPTPTDFDGSMEQMCEHVAHYPNWVLAVVVPLWGFTALLSIGTARRIGGRIAASLVGVLLIAGVIGNVSLLPYPLWFKITCVIIVSIAVVLAVRTLARQRAINA